MNVLIVQYKHDIQKVLLTVTSVLLTFLFLRRGIFYGTQRRCLSFLTQESGDVVVDLISVSCVVELQVDVGAEIILSAEHLETLSEERRAQKHVE